MTRYYLWVALILFLSCGTGRAELDTVLLLHTNDLHDHLRKDYDDRGGMPYVSGYIKKIKSERNDVLVLDAGDVMEKGDMVAYRTQSTMMYEAIGEIGYDAITPGNHDDAYGLDHLQACAALAPKTAMLCINMVRPGGELLFPASKVFDVDGVRVGVIGATRAGGDHSLSDDETGERIANEATRLSKVADLVIVTTHMGVGDCMRLAEQAPDVDVFVSGHTHTALMKPSIYEPTGALIVQAGSYAEYVGRLELTVDLDEKRIVEADGSLVPMDHAIVPCDEAMLARAKKKEQEIAPEATKKLLTTTDTIGMLDLSFLGAEALRQAAGADIGFCHTGQVLRDILPAGEVDINALFRTGGQRGADVVLMQLTGSTITAYLQGLARTDWGQTRWSGFRGGSKRVNGAREMQTDLATDKVYSVVMTLKEWDTRFARWAERHNNLESRSTPAPDLSFTDAIVTYIRKDNLDEAALRKRLEQLKRDAAL